MFAFISKSKSKNGFVVRKHFARKKKQKKIPFLLNKKKLTSKHRSSSNRESVNILDKFFDFRIYFDKKLLLPFLILLIIGLIAVFSSTIVFAYRYTGDKYFYLFNQIRLIGIGFIFMSLFYFIRIEVISKLWFIPFSVSIGLLLYLFYLIITSQAEIIDGASRWIKLGGFQFQPSDFAKLSFIIFLASFLGKLPLEYRNFNEYFKRNLGPFLLTFLLTVILILLGRNLGTALVVGMISLVCYWVTATSKYQKFGFVLLCSLVILGGTMFGLYEGYRMQRIKVWTNYLKTGDTAIPNKDGILSRREESYQFDQILTAMGSGGIIGVGLGESIGKFYFVKTTAGDDSIIGIIAEELGFFMTVGLLLLYIYLVFGCLNLANKVINNRVYYLLLIGIASWIFFQMFVHVGSNLGVIPFTGQTLPFISIGGSSLISLMGAYGIVLNISKQYKMMNDSNKR